MYCTMIAIAVLLIMAYCAGKAEGHHNGAYLPLVPNTPLMQSIKATGEFTWCVNASAEVYPGFVAQLKDVNDQYTARVGIKHRQVAWGTPASTGCQEQHNFINGLQCGGCAAHVFYASWPVVVEYKMDLAFTDWRSTAGHEGGHSRLGLHEQYDDSTFTCLSDRTWTVMSCNTFVRYPQPFDVTNGCAVLATSWCGKAPEPPPCGNPCWTGSRWMFADLWSFEPSSNIWYRPDGIATWINCNTGGNSACWSLVKNEWVWAGSHVWYDGLHLYPPVN